MHILLTNFSLASRTGTELYVRDVALALARRGHRPIAYSTLLGDVAQELRDATIPVVDTLADVGQSPDLIHGQHHLETMTALTHFPDVPAIYVCHGWRPWEEAPPRFSRIYRYVAVDQAVRDRLVLQHGIPAERVVIIHNFVDLQRFLPRRPLPSHPRTALLFSNYVHEKSPYLHAVREACARMRVSLDVVGAGVNNSSLHPEQILPNYDIVFAQGRSAIEALAVGCAVVIGSSRRLGPLVRTHNVESLLDLNFGIRTQNYPVQADILTRELMNYDPRDAAEVSQRIRQQAGLESAVDAMAELYEEALAEHRSIRNAPAESREIAAYLRWLTPRMKQAADLLVESNRLKNELQTVAETRDALHREILGIRISATWRLREYLLHFRPVAVLQQSLQRWLEHKDKGKRKSAEQKSAERRAGFRPKGGKSAGCHILCLLPVRNGETDLPGYFESVARFSDGVLALDDGSTDRTRALLESNPLVRGILENPVRESYLGWDDAANRQRLLDEAQVWRPRWILSLDADERISEDDAEALLDFLRHGALADAAYGFQVCRMQDKECRTYDRGNLWAYRLFAFRPGQRFPGRRLHGVPVPETISEDRWFKTTLRIQHLGGSSAERRQMRFEKYREVDPHHQYQNDYTNLLEATGEIRTWSRRRPDDPVLIDEAVHRQLGISRWRRWGSSLIRSLAFRPEEQT